MDLSEVGLQDYTVLIRSPSGQIVDHQTTSDYSSLCKAIAYVPQEAGPHEIYINYITFELPGELCFDMVPITTSDYSSLCKFITYTPQEAGPYEIYIIYIAFELPGELCFDTIPPVTTVNHL